MNMRNEDFIAGRHRHDGLSEHDKKVLDFAGRSFSSPREQDGEIRREFDYGGTTFWRNMARLVDPTNPVSNEALTYAPDVVNQYQNLIADNLGTSR